MSVATVNSLFTALSGIQTTQQLLNTTTRNITNAQSPGYVRKEQQAVSNAFTGGSLAGPIRRFVDAALLQKLRTNNGDAAFNDVRADALTKMNQLAGDPEQGTSVSARINTLGAAFQEITANPQNASAAAAVIDAARTLAQSLNQQNDALIKLRTDANIAIVDQVAQVNKQLQLIASLNQKVTSQQALDRDPTDLMDQRDIAISELSKLMDIHAFTDNQGVVQVLASDFHPLAGLYSEVVTYNQVTQAVAVSGHQINTVGGKIGGNIQVMNGDALQRLQNLSEVANNLTSLFQGLPTSIVSLNGTLQVPAPNPAAGDIPVPGLTKLITDNGNQYSATLAYRSTGTGGNSYQLVVANMVPIQGAPAVTTNTYNAAAGTGGYVIGTVDASTTPPTFSGQAAQLTPSTATAQPGVVRLLTAFTTGLSSTAGASAPTAITANNATTLFTQSSGAIPSTTLAFAAGALLPNPGSVQATNDSAASTGFTLTTSTGNQYTATVAFRPKTPGVAGNGYDVVVTSLTAIGTSPGTGSLNYNAATMTGGLTIGSFDAGTNPPTFFSTGTITAIPGASTAPSKFPGHIEPITSITGVASGGFTAAVAVTPANNITSPFYAGNIQVNPSITVRALQVGDQFATTAQDNNAGAAQSTVLAILNRVMTFATSGISGAQTIEDGAAAMTVGIGQDLANTNNKITELTTAGTQIQQAIAPDSEVNLDTEMSKLVVLQTAYQANARVVNTVANLLDTLINLAQ